MNRLLFPGPTREYAAHTDAYGDTSVLSTKDFLYGLERDVEHTVELEPGVTLLIELGAVSEADAHGMRTVVTTLNGQIRPVTVRDRSVEVDVEARGEGGPRQPRPRRRPVRGRRDAGGREGDDGGAGPDGRDDRGDEDGGVDHRAARRDRDADGHRPGAAGGGRRPAAGAGVAPAPHDRVGSRRDVAGARSVRGGREAGPVTRIVAGRAGGRRLAVPPPGPGRRRTGCGRRCSAR